MQYASNLLSQHDFVLQDVKGIPLVQQRLIFLWETVGGWSHSLQLQHPERRYYRSSPQTGGVLVY